MGGRLPPKIFFAKKILMDRGIRAGIRAEIRAEIRAATRAEIPSGESLSLPSSPCSTAAPHSHRAPTARTVTACTPGLPSRKPGPSRVV